MKTSLKANLLKHFITKKEEGGFTLIELLVVIIIIGILAAIALPSFLNQANKAKQSEAKTYVGSMNRAQQAYYLENGNFAAQANFNLLGLGIAQETTNYKYAIDGGGVGSKGVWSVALPGKGTDSASSLKGYGGGVNIAVIGSGATGEATTLAVLCEALNSPVQSGPLSQAQVKGIVTVPVDGTTAPSCNTTNSKPIQ